MPRERVAVWMAERNAWLEQHPEPHSIEEQAEYDERFLERWERWLDECHGACELARPDIKRVVQDALAYYEGSRYRLESSVVMPNHVHVLVTPLEEHAFSDIVQNWKSFTSHAINTILGREGPFWQKESFDHIVRNADQMERFRRYIRANPRGPTARAE